jgi:succinoglycan biosynthesis protein ExoA
MPGVAPEYDPEPSPFVSVIVPARNEEAFIEHTLRALLHQDYAGPFEVLVADGQSTDRTAAVVEELAARYVNLRLIDNERRWSSAGRNRAIRKARGNLIVVVDAHCEPPPADYLQNVADAFQRSGAACLGRPQPLNIADASAVQRAIAVARSSWLGHHPDSHIYSAKEAIVPPQSVAVAYRRWVFDEVGLFDEAFDACEDVEFNHRVACAGLSCFFTPRAALHYVPRATLPGLFRQMIRYGRGRLRLLRKHPETFSISSLVPALFLLGLAAGTVLAWLSSWLALAFGSALGCYALTVLAVSLQLSLRQRDRRIFGWLLLVFPTIHLGAGAGLLWEWLTGRHPRDVTVGQEAAASRSRLRARMPLVFEGRASTAIED